jgi:hypothetical protein
MTALALEGHLGTEVTIDLCAGCHLFWFDHLESLRLSPASTLRLFEIIGRQKNHPGPLPEPLKCPRCDLRLLLTNDRQRNTAFRYWRCAREHGRLISFFDFLREKDFIRPLTPAQLADLRRNIQQINCSNCGAAIDLMRASECAHCGTPVSTLDLEQIAVMANQLRSAGEHRPSIDVDTLFAAMRAERDRERTRESPEGLVEAGLRLVSGWLNWS